MWWVGEGREDATVAVRGVFAQADIDTEHEGGEEFGEKLEGENDGCLRIVGSASSSVLVLSAHLPDDI